ncbi:cell division protein FtsL [Candidatus Pelagibacter sp.]|nr:cell division protein FtsL [Candidatus Pelagibacter sp.]
MLKKILIFIPIIILIISTTFTKNSTKKLDKKIFEIQEDLRALNDIYELVLLDYNYLTSPNKLMGYSQMYFEKELRKIEITDLKNLTLKNE